jgi:hypothetical protein
MQLVHFTKVELTAWHVEHGFGHVSHSFDVVLPNVWLDEQICTHPDPCKK